MTPQEALRQRRTIVAALVEMDFPAGMLRAWTGLIPFTTPDGRLWQPVADIGVVRFPEVTDGFESRQFSVGLRRAADDNRLDFEAFAAAARADRNIDVLGRPITIYLQTFRVEDDDDGGAGEPIGEPIPEIVGEMSHLEATRQGRSSYSLEVVCEDPFVDGYIPANGFWTAEDQLQRFPGDLGCNLITVNATRQPTWPRD